MGKWYWFIFRNCEEYDCHAIFVNEDGGSYSWVAIDDCSSASVRTPFCVWFGSWHTDEVAAQSLRCCADGSDESWVIVRS